MAIKLIICDDDIGGLEKIICLLMIYSEKQVFVYTYASWIAKREGLDRKSQNTTAAVTLTHDIGIGVAKEKHGMSNWNLQEQKGPPARRK